jgi:hypothetical protein
MIIINNKTKKAGIQSLINIKQAAELLQSRELAILVSSNVNKTALYIKDLFTNK